ncbi:MAG: ATP-binding protein [Amoebophilaceae bacterium]|nr:ATP-binding protein [Amoebophilaceae bacterium]
MYKVPIGVDNFHKLVTGGYLFCDKTAMIAEFLSKGEEVALITRPRRWGKTLNMSMLQHFLSAEVNGVSTAGLFDNLAIGKLEGGKYIHTHQGKYPVIMLSFKDVKADGFEGAMNLIYLLLKRQYGAFEYLLKSEQLNSDQKYEFSAILNRSANQGQLEYALKLLSECLYQHHGQRVYIFIDEYDTPLNQAYGHTAYLESLVGFMRNLFSAGLKGNDALERGLLTGILRVSKDSMLSGLNNLKSYTMLDKSYSSHFGFSEEETKTLFEGQGLVPLPLDFDEVRHWYNGYKSGDLVVYNPWSILYCLSEDGIFDVYWVNTGNNDLIKRSVLRSNSGIKIKFEQLMQGETICVPIDKHLSFDLLDQDETTFWSLLLFAGYLKASSVTFNEHSGLHDCALVIPNQEVHTLYYRFFKEWLSDQFSNRTQYESFLDHLVSGNVSLFVQELGDFLIQSVSVYDTHKKSEGFYHGFVLALIASLRSTHHVQSNRESGYGRYDVLIIPKGGTQALSSNTFTTNGPQALLLEFKQVAKEEELENAARAALGQIQAQAYRTELLAYPYVREIVEVGIAFSGKSVLAAYSVYDLVHKQAAPVQLTSRYGSYEQVEEKQGIDKRSIAKHMLKEGLDINLIMKITGLPKETINALYKESCR